MNEVSLQAMRPDIYVPLTPDGGAHWRKRLLRARLEVYRTTDQ